MLKQNRKSEKRGRGEISRHTKRRGKKKCARTLVPEKRRGKEKYKESFSHEERKSKKREEGASQPEDVVVEDRGEHAAHALI